MAIEGLSHNIGIGTGSAQVFDTSRVVNAFKERQRQEQAQKAAEDKYFEGLIGKLNPDGMKNVDIDALSNEYRPAIISAWGKYKNASSPEERITAQREFMGAINKGAEFIAKSKNENKNILNNSNFIRGLHSTERASDALPNLAYLTNTRSDDPEYNTKASAMRFDKQERESDLTKDWDDIFKSSAMDYETPFQDVGKDRREKKVGKQLSFDKVRENTLVKTQNNPLFKRTIDRYYKDDFESRNDQDVAREVEAAKQLGIKDYNPNDIYDFVALKEYKANKGSSKYESYKIIADEYGKGKGLTINIGGGTSAYSPNAVGSGGKELYTTAINSFGKPVTTKVSAPESYTMANIKGNIVKSPNIRSLRTGDKVTDAGNLTFDGGEVVLAPVYKKGFKAAGSGKELDDMMVSDDVLTKEKAKGLVEYKPVFMFRDKEGDEDYYIPAKDILANVQLLKANKDDAPQLEKMVKQLEELKGKYNQGVPKVKARSTYGQPTTKAKQPTTKKVKLGKGTLDNL